jgi:hypothetical protein
MPAATTALMLLFLLAVSHAAFARVPPDFIGISPQSAPNERDYALMEEAGLRSVRLPLFWSAVERVSPLLEAPDWRAFDLGVELAARHGMTVMPVVGSSPPWVAPEQRLEPVARAWQLRAWTSFLRRAVLRYGEGGSFWWQH